MMYDFHTHLVPHDKTIAEFRPLDGSLGEVLVSTSPNDWKRVLEYGCGQDQQVFPSLGVHPWYVLDTLVGDMQDGITLEVLDNKLMETLRSLIESLETCTRIGVGETGLDKAFRLRGNDLKRISKSMFIKVQRAVFVGQLVVATVLQRPITIHCVRSEGVLQDVLKGLSEGGPGSITRTWLSHELFPCTSLMLLELLDQTQVASFPPLIYLHSWSGSVESTNHLLSSCSQTMVECIYFGVSHVINGGGSTDKFVSRVNVIPRDRILPETDWYAGDVQTRQAHLQQVVDEVSNALQISTKLVTEMFMKNGSLVWKTWLSGEERSLNAQSEPGSHCLTSN